MLLPNPLVEARLIRRYKRFLADVDIPGQGVVTVHCPDPGAMLHLQGEGARVWLVPTPRNKLPYRWTLIETEGGLVGIDTSLPNHVADEAIRLGLVPELAGYASQRREVRYGVNSRIDFLLEAPDRPPAYVEVKNVHLRRSGTIAEFPDCVTARGTKHLVELAEVVRNGGRAVMLYIVQRADCDIMALAEDIDPAYAFAFDRALQSGVEALCYGCAVTRESIDLNRALAFPRAERNRP